MSKKLSYNCLSEKSWNEESSVEALDFQYLTKMQTRRMDILTRYSLELALRCSEGFQVDYLVYASRHGQLHYSYDLIKDILVGETPSPIKFSQSTHNSIGGLYCILSKNKIPMTAISAGNNTKRMGLLSALNHLESFPEHNVLLIYSDGLIPEAYSQKIAIEERSKRVSCSLITSGNQFSYDFI